MPKLRVMLAEDHFTVREGIKLLINSQPDMQVVGEAGDGLEAVRDARSLAPDVLVMDVSMPNVNGLTATIRIRREAPAIKIVALTRHADEAYLRQLIESGASGYVLKQSVPDELIRAIRAVAEGGNYLDPALTGRFFGGPASRPASPRGAVNAAVSDRESEVLRYIALGYTNKEIAEVVRISVKTVEAHKANAMRKLDMRNRVDVVRYAILRGWMTDK